MFASSPELLSEVTPEPLPEPTLWPEPSPEPPPPPRSAPFTRDELWPLLVVYPWPAEQALLVVFGPTAVCPNGESGGDPLADNGQDRGLFQINRASHEYRFWRRGWDWQDAYDPERNIAIAYEIYAESGGWGPWSCRPVKRQTGIRG